MRQTSEITRSIELDWYAKRNVWASLIDVFNPQDDPDPERWDAVFSRWDEAEASFEAALALPIADDTINAAASNGEEALKLFDDALLRSQTEREAFAGYMEGFTKSAEAAVTVTTLARDIAFCAAVGAAVVVAAPVVAGGIAAVGTGTLAFAAGSAALTTAEVVGTGLAMGVLGAAIEGSVEGLATLSVQAIAAIEELLEGSGRAADEFDWAAVTDAGFDRMCVGFVDGVLGFAGVQAERVLASYASASVRSWLGAGSCNLYAILLRRSLTRALSGGATGSVIGALDAGLKAAIEGRDLAGITSAMEVGFGIGLVGGTVLGAAGGAWEARGADQLRQQVAGALRERAAAAMQPATLEDDLLSRLLLEELRENPTAGTNQQLIDLTPGVWTALHDPDTLAAALSEVWLEEHLLGLLASTAAAERYGEAALTLARRRGAPVVVLPRGQTFDQETFFTEVVAKGNRFLDFSVLGANPDHGASTHLIQDLAVDRVLEGTGVKAEQYHALLAGAVGRDGRSIGNDIWIQFFDPLHEHINNPDVLYAVMRESLDIP